MSVLNDVKQPESTPDPTRKRSREITPSKVSPPCKNQKTLDPEDIDSINLEFSETIDMGDTGEQGTIEGQRRPHSIDVAELQQVFSSPAMVAIFESLIDKSIDKHIKPIHEALSEHKCKITELKGKVDDLTSSLTSANQRIDDLEQYSRRNNLRISCSVKENSNENTDNIVTDIIAKDLGVNIDINEIDRSHRVGKPSGNGKPRTILVKFISYRARDKLYSARKKSKSGIFVSEDLTRRRQGLFFKARQHYKLGSFSHTWTKDGKILVRLPNGDVNLITDPTDIEAALNQVNDEDREKILGTRRGPRNQKVKIDSPSPLVNEQSAD